MQRKALGFLVVMALLCVPAWTQESIDGTYTFVQDSDGTKSPPEVSITLTLSRGEATLISTPADPAYTDSGSYMYSSGRLLSFVLPRMGKFARGGNAKLQNGVLTLPFKLIGAGSGSSTWHEPKTSGPPEAAHESLTKLLDSIVQLYDERVPLRVRNLLLEFSGPEDRDLLNSGTALNMVGQIPESAYLLARSARMSAEAQTLNNLGHVLSMDDEAGLARGVLLFAKQAAPKNPHVFNNLAYADYQLKRYAEAEVAARKAVALLPEPDFYWNLCKILYAARKMGEARAACDEAYSRGIKGMLYPGARKGGGKGKAGDTPPADDGPGSDEPPGPDNPPGPDDGNRGPDLKEPESNDDEGAENAPEADPDATIIGQIGKRDTKNDGKKPKPYEFPSNPKTLKELNPKAAEWVGHWEGDKATGCINRIREFGKGLAMTKVHENLCHYAQKVSFDVDEMGNIKGKGEAVYVIYDKADMYATMMLPLPLPPGGFFATFPGGYRIRKFDIEGVVQPNGTVLIGGRSEKPMYLLNVYMFTKVYPWNVFPPPADDASKPGVLQISPRGNGWVMEATRRGIKTGMNYQTLIYKSNKKRSMVKGCRVFCEKQVDFKDTGDSKKIGDLKCSMANGPFKEKVDAKGAEDEVSVGPVKISGNSEQLNAELNTGAITAKVGAVYGKPGDIDKLIKAQQVGTCQEPEKGINEKAGTMKFDLGVKLSKDNAVAQNFGFSNERNPITGDETFSVGFGGGKSAGEGVVTADVKWGARLVVNSRCGVGLRLNFTESVKGEGSQSGKMFGKDFKQTSNCSLERSQTITVWASGTILE